MNSVVLLALFPDRDRLERAVERLVGTVLDRSQVSILTSEEGLESLRRGEHVDDLRTRPQLDRTDTANAQGVLAGIPTYAVAVLAAGITVASGGTLAGVALAALGGAGVGGLLGAGAARLFAQGLDPRYDLELARGGLVLVVSPHNEEQALAAETALEDAGAESVTRQADDERQSPSHDDSEPGPLLGGADTATGPVADSSRWTG